MLRTFGKYELLGEIGMGGMATVYKAKDTSLDRLVALKVISQRLQGGEEARKRFLNEARVAAVLNHKNIVAVYELGVEDGFPFIAMEYLSGRDLRDVIEERQPWTLRQKLQTALHIARALEHAHSRGVIHRDIKPGNIRVLEDGTAKLMDFGIAKLVSAELTRLTRTGSVMGTAAYMAPEQLRGEPPNESADVFAFGIVLYELLTWNKPFDAPHPAAMVYKILNTEPAPIQDTDIPDSVKMLLARCMEKDAAQRAPGFAWIVRELTRIRKDLRLRSGRPEEQTDPANPTMSESDHPIGIDVAHHPTGPRSAVHPDQPVFSGTGEHGGYGGWLTAAVVVLVGAGAFGVLQSGGGLRRGAENAGLAAGTPIAAQTPARPSRLLGAQASTSGTVAHWLSAEASVEAIQATPAKSAAPSSATRSSASPTDSTTRGGQRKGPSAPPPSADLHPAVSRASAEALGSASSPPPDSETGGSAGSAPRDPTQIAELIAAVQPIAAPDAGTAKTHTIRLGGAPDDTDICVDSKPWNAMRAGLAWLLTDLTPGEHRLDLFHAQRGSASVAVTVVDGPDPQVVRVEPGKWRPRQYRIAFRGLSGSVRIVEHKPDAPGASWDRLEKPTELESGDAGLRVMDGNVDEDYRLEFPPDKRLVLRFQWIGRNFETGELRLERSDGVLSSMRCVSRGSQSPCGVSEPVNCGIVD